MKNLIIVIIIVLGMTGSVFAQDELKLNTQVDFFSKYIWRGQTATDDPVVQPSINFSYKHFTLSTWGNMELTNTNNNRWNITETDVIVDYTNYLPGQSMIEYSLGFIRYDFPNTSFDDTTEIYAGLGLKILFNPSVKVFRDIDEVDGTYVSLGVSESLWFGYDFAASLGWGDRNYNRSYWGKSSSRTNDFLVSLSRQIETKWFDIVPSISYIRLMDKDLGSMGDAGNDDVIFGISIKKSFK